MLWSGIIILAIWFVLSAGVAWMASGETSGQNFTGAFIGSQLLFGLPLLVGGILFTIGLVAALSARAFDVRDRAAAAALTGAISELLGVDPQVAYADDGSLAHVSGATLVEVERHFDRDTAGQMVTTVNHHMSLSGTHSSMTHANTTYGRDWSDSTYATSVGSLNASGQITGTEVSAMSQTTRDNLMGDALFSIFEHETERGHRDTQRVVAMSRPAAEGWIRDLAGSVCYQVGGPNTHAGGAVWALAGHLVAHFGPRDVSYVTDRLKAQEKRSDRDRDIVRIEGVPMERGAMIATTMSIGSSEALRLYPVHFPVLFAGAINAAARRRVHVETDRRAALEN